MRRRKGTKQGMASRLVSLLLAVMMLAGSLPLAGFEVQAAKKTSDNAQTAQTPRASGSGFQHPGLLHTQEGFNKMRENIDNNVQPNRATWDALWFDGFSNPGWGGRPVEHVFRGGRDNINQLRIDLNRAYQNALIWKISGDEAHGEAACRIMNGWSATMKSLGGNADRFLAAGLQGYQMANIGEIMRDHPDFNTEALQNLLLNIFYPMNDDFMIRHNDAYIGNYWANWELANLASMISIGVYCDREDIYERALNYFKTGKGNGSFYHTMPYVFDGVQEGDAGFAQWQESVRDQGHTVLGLMLCGVIMETAWNQGDDLYGMSDNRFMKAAEYIAAYNSLGRNDLPSNWYEYRKGKKPDIVWYIGNIDYQRGNWRPIYHQMYNHYANRKGLEMPNVEELISREGYIEGAPGRTSYDELGWYGVTYANLDTRVEDEPIEGDLTDGVYRIVSAASGKSLVVNQEGSLASAEKGSRKDEWWIVKNKGDGEYILTNLMTGKLMQVNDEGTGIRNIGGTDFTYSTDYLNGTQIGTGEADPSRALAQSFAFLAESDGSFRIVPSMNYYVLSLENNNHADNARVVQWWNDAIGAYWNYNNDNQRWRVEKADEIGAEFTFDDGSSGFRTDYAYLDGDYSLVRHGEGMALSFDGSGEFQTLGTITDKSIFAGMSGFTVSFEVRPKSGGKNWLLYAAPNGENQDPAKGTYLGVKEENGTVTAEVCKDGAVSAASASVSDIVGAGNWYQVSVSFSPKETVLYVNGQELARTARDYPVSDIVNENSILQVGKANLGEGEYCQGAVDNLKITGHVMTTEEVLEEASEYAYGNLPEVLAEFTFDDEETGFSGGAAVASGPHKLVDHDGGKALFLDGWRDFLKVTGKDGGTLVPGGLIKEMTITMQVKMEGGTGWVFYAAPDNKSPLWLQEQYLGVMDSNGEVVAQRFKNQGSHAPYPRVETKKDSWHYLTIVFSENETIVYEDGEKKGQVENNIPLSEILGGNSIFQIGKANWQTGEYFRGMIDNYRILSHAFTEEEVKTDVLRFVEKTALQEAVDSQSAEAEEIYTPERWKEYQSALQTAETVLADKEALQSAVNSAESALSRVQAWMRMDEALHAAVPEEQEAVYTVNTWEPYAKALSEAKTLNENKEAANADLIAKAKALRDTCSVLLKKGETVAEAVSRINAIETAEGTLERSRKAILARKICSLLTEEELESVTNLSVLAAAEAELADYLAEFTFDDNENGFMGGQAMAEGSYAIKNGALYLDGTGSWLDVKKADGSSLLTGRDELTISFAAHPETGGSNWMFFAAPNTDAQELNQENYLGIIEFEESITAQRFMNTDGRPDSAQIDDIKVSDWIYVTVVYAKDKTILYLNGKKVTEQASDISLSGTPGDANHPGILGNSSVLQIGKGNWGTGEYYKGYLDNFKIMGKVLTAEEIQAEADAYLGSAINVAKIENVVSGIDAIGEKIEASVDTRKSLEEIRANYESLTEEEKKLVPNIETLIGAEEVYQEKLEDAQKLLAEFTLDDAETGLKGSGALAEGNGTLEFVEDAERGKVLSLNGENWLNVKKEDGSSLLTGAEELTVSYYSKAGRPETNWAFYAAPKADAQVLGSEYYIGILENNKNVTAERFLGGRQPSASSAYKEGWNHIVVVYGADDTKLYVNGTLANTAENSEELTGILGTESILQLGKANWGEGEYYLGLLDDVKIYNHALSERDIKMLTGEIADTADLKEKIQEAKLINQRSYTEESYAVLQEAIKQARKDRDTLETQEELTAAIAALQEAIDGLVPTELEKADLQAKLEEAKAIKQGHYSISSYNNLQTALQEAEEALAEAKIQEKLDQALDNLVNAIGALKELIYTDLNEKIAEAEVIELGDYTNETYEALQEVLKTVKHIRDTAGTQADLDQAASDLQKAIDGLKALLYTNLDAKLKIARAIRQGTYSNETYGALQAAIQTAQSTRDTQRIQADLDLAVKNLQEAIEALKELDYTKLDAKLQEAEAIEQGNYTDETYEALQIAIQTAQGIKATVKSQSDLDQAVPRLQAAVDALKENTQKPGEPEKPDDPNKPGEPEKPDDPNKPENPGDDKDILVKELKINPAAKNVTVGESFDVTVLVSPDNAKNKEVQLTSSNPAVAKVEGKKVTALSAGQAVITVKAQDGSNTKAELKVTVRLKPVSAVKAVQQSAKKYVKVSFGKVSGASGYDIYRSVKASGGYKRIGSSTKNSYVDKKAGAGKTYYYKVVAKAKTAVCGSVLSTNYAKVKVLAVAKVKVKASKGRKLTVTWKKIKGASGYAVYTSTKKTKGFKKVKTIKKAKTVKAVIKAKKNVKKLYVKVRPYSKASGKSVFGTYSKTITVKVKK